MLLRGRVFLILIFFNSYSYASEYLVERVSNSSHVSLSKIINKKEAVIMFFKPECPACRRQVDKFSCLGKSISKIALGFGGDKKSLWRESKKLKLKKKFGKNIFIANQETKKIFGLSNSYSPQIFIFKKGRVSKHFLGITDCLILKKAF